MIKTISMLFVVGLIGAWSAPASANEAFCPAGSTFKTDGNSKAWCETTTFTNLHDAACKGDYSVNINGNNIVLQHPSYVTDKSGQEDRCVVSWTPPHPSFGPTPKPLTYDFSAYCPLHKNIIAGHDKCYDNSSTSRSPIQLRGDT